MTVDPARRYADGPLGHDVPGELHRLQLRERFLDPRTKDLLDGRGLSSRVRCLEIGAGTGTIAQWLTTRCGTVLATDTDIRYLEPLRHGILQVLRHDVVTDSLPASAFDLIHARSVLANLPERDSVITKLATALAPGGWLVVEDPAIFGVDSSPFQAYAALVTGFERYMARSHGADLRWARRLPLALAQAGMKEIGLQVHPQYIGAGGDEERAWRATLAQSVPGMLATGEITAEQLDDALAEVDQPSFIDLGLVMVAAWGRHP